MELFLNHACNLRCTYCYNHKQTANPMSDQVMPAALEMAFAAPAKIINVGFFGGEPLLSFDQVRRGVAMARELAKKHSKIMRLIMTTNGTLLSGKILDFLDRNRFRMANELWTKKNCLFIKRFYEDDRMRLAMARCSPSDT